MSIIEQNSPFNLDNDSAYQAWRSQKLALYPSTLSDLVVNIKDPYLLTRSEHEAIVERCKRFNMAIYASPVTKEDKAISHEISKQFSLTLLDNNMCSDEDSITSLTVAKETDKRRQTYIPYTDKPIHWHTDGYYNALNYQIYALLLHCVRSAKEGGENALLDHEIAYILMRDENPAYIEKLMQEDAMCIPPNIVEGKELRPLRCGPVFSVMPDGHLHMRYTKRTRSIAWKKDETTQAAVRFLENLLDSDSPYIFRGTLQAGQGLVSNNVLHDRSGFVDFADPTQHRLLYRGRFFQRVSGS